MEGCPIFPRKLQQHTQIDEDIIKRKDHEALEGLGGPMTRARTRKAKEALQQVLAASVDVGPNLEDLKSKMVHCIMTSEDQ